MAIRCRCLQTKANGKERPELFSASLGLCDTSTKLKKLQVISEPWSQVEQRQPLSISLVRSLAISLFSGLGALESRGRTGCFGSYLICLTDSTRKRDLTSVRFLLECLTSVAVLLRCFQYCLGGNQMQVPANESKWEREARTVLCVAWFV